MWLVSFPGLWFPATEIELTTFYRALVDDLYRFTLSLFVPTRVSMDLQLTWTVSSSYLRDL